MKCTNCGNSPNNVDEIRQCSRCQQNGTAAAVHCRYAGGTTLEQLVADANPGAFPFENDQPAAAETETAHQADEDDMLLNELRGEEILAQQEQHTDIDLAGTDAPGI